MARQAPARREPLSRERILRVTRDAFYVDTDGWKARIVAQGVEAAHQAVAGLRG